MVALAAGDPSTCGEVAGRFGGELLPEERDEEWAVIPRERLQTLYFDLLRVGGLWEALAEGTEGDAAPGDLFEIEPGHDAWIVGDEPCVLIDFLGAPNDAKP